MAPDPIQVRYLRTPAGRARIDLSVESPDAIYNRFDDPVPYANRNLDPALVQYLVDCATELDPELPRDPQSDAGGRDPSWLSDSDPRGRAAWAPQLTMPSWCRPSSPTRCSMAR